RLNANTKDRHQPMEFLATIHDIFFRAILMFSGVLGVWAIVMAARDRSISGNFWGALVTLTGLSLVTLVAGTILALQGFTPPAQRLTTYFIYMAWIVIIIPGMFTQLRGRDDSAAALAFAMLAIFNLFVGLSMQGRGLVGPWA
ncbi:MAG: hypothetical protein AAFR22_06010, partial [Chloroflexota bacterium]